MFGCGVYSGRLGWMVERLVLRAAGCLRTDDMGIVFEANLT